MGKEDLCASPGAEGWRDILQLLREQSENIEVLARALSVIQQGMLRNNPGHVKDSVKEATEVLSGPKKNQFGFRKGRCTVDAIQIVVDIATKARRKTGKRKKFCALISIDIRNLFNTARWNICIEVMVRKKVPDYLLRMIDDYFSDRWVI